MLGDAAAAILEHRAAEQDIRAMAARFLVLEKREDGAPLDPVARFHLGNGARIERLNWLGDPSKKGLKQSAGIMVNYAYLPSQIEKNHEAYVKNGRVAAAASVRAQARGK